MLRQPGAGLVGMGQNVVESQEQVTLAGAVAAADDKVAFAISVTGAERGLQAMEEPLERGRGIRGLEDPPGITLKGCGVLVEQSVEGDDTVQVALDNLRAQGDQLLDAGHRHTSYFDVRERKNRRTGA